MQQNRLFNDPQRDGRIVAAEQGRQISEIRAARGLTAAELGQLAGLSWERVCEVEKGNGMVGELQQICGALGLEINMQPDLGRAFIRELGGD